MEEYVSLTSPNTPVSPLSNACTSPGELHASMSGKVCGVCGDKVCVQLFVFLLIILQTLLLICLSLHANEGFRLQFWSHYL